VNNRTSISGNFKIWVCYGLQSVNRHCPLDFLHAYCVIHHRRRHRVQQWGVVSHHKDARCNSAIIVSATSCSTCCTSECAGDATGVCDTWHNSRVLLWQHTWNGSHMWTSFALAARRRRLRRICTHLSRITACPSWHWGHPLSVFLLDYTLYRLDTRNTWCWQY